MDGTLEHRCNTIVFFKCYVPSTNFIRDVDTVKFFPTHIPLPYISPDNYLNQSATDILTTLQTTLSIVLSLEYGDRTKNVLVKIVELLVQATQKKTIVLLVSNPTPNMPHISLPV